MTNWTCDYGPLGKCRNPHGCHCREIANLSEAATNANAFDAMKEALEPALVALEIQPRTVTENGEPYLTPLWTPEQSEMRAAAKRKVRAALRLASGEEQ